MATGQQAVTHGDPRRSRARWLIVLGAAAFCVAVLFALYNAEPVEVAKSHLEQSGGQVYVAGQVHNRSNSARTVKLELHYYDGAGHALGLDTLNLERLPAGSISNFHGPAHQAGTIAAYSIYLNEGRNPYGN